MVPVRTLVVVVGMLANATLMAADIRVSAQLPRLRDEVTVRGLRPRSERRLPLHLQHPGRPARRLARNGHVSLQSSHAWNDSGVEGESRAARWPWSRPFRRGAQRRPTGTRSSLAKPPSSGAPRPIKAWFLPGREIGQELIYPKWQTAKQ